MSTLEILPFIIFIVVIVTAISEHISIPYPLLLVAAGILVGFMPGIPNWAPPSDVVLAIFLPPILFSAARRISWRDVRNNFGTIFSLSIVLVCITTVAIAIVLNYYVPQVTLATALVLGAIISPTDTVAAVATLNNMNVRRSIIHTIKVESLFNDAMGIVLYNAALAKVFFGALSITGIAFHTVVVGVGGIAIGLLFAFLSGLIIKQFLTLSKTELPIIMSLILAYVAYLFADRIGASGVMAVVAAGLYHKRTEQLIDARARLTENTVWDTLIFFLNGIVFITIGIQFPAFLKKITYLSTGEILLFSCITIAALLVLRFIWVTINNYCAMLFARFRRGEDAKMKFSWRTVTVLSWSGMRGLVSLALAIAIPAAISSGEVFPYRELIIFLTITTILFTLLIQGLTLPALVRRLGLGKDDIAEQHQTQTIHRRMTESAMRSINQLRDEDQPFPPAAIRLVENYYANRLLQMNAPSSEYVSSQEVRQDAKRLLKKILQQERDYLNELRSEGEIGEEIYIDITHKLDRDEVGFAAYH